MATATHGSAILFPSEAFNPSEVIRVLRLEETMSHGGVTGLYGVSTMFIAELELLQRTQNKTKPKEKEFKRLTKGIAAGSSVPRKLMERLRSEMGLEDLAICYGMTETSPVSCMTALDDPVEKKVDSVGKLMPWVEAKIVSPADGHLCEIGEKGELVVSGYLVMEGGYFGDEVKTAEVLKIEYGDVGEVKEGGKKWIYTGDEAEMDQDGYVRITGRIKDLIIRGGENIHPTEIENVLLGMSEVKEASVVGVGSEKYGEEVAVFVAAHGDVEVGSDDAGLGGKGEGKLERGGQGGEAEAEGKKILTKEMVKEYVRGQLSNHLVPKYVFWIDEFPKTASGKIQKFLLRERGDLLLKGEVKGDRGV